MKSSVPLCESSVSLCVRLHIRKAKVEDSAALARVQVDSYRTAYAGIFPQPYLDRFSYEEQEQDWQDLLSAGTADDLLVAETDAGEIAGYALGRRGATGLPPYDGELVALHVRDGYQRQGIGQELVAAVAAWLKQAGCTSLLVWVLEKNPARQFYEQMGGELLANTKVYQGAVEVAYGWSSLESLCRQVPLCRGQPPGRCIGQAWTAGGAPPGH